MSNEKIIDIDSNIEQAADALTFTSATIERFINETEDFKFELGYEGKSISFYGFTDEWSIAISPDSVEMTAQGRDNIQKAIDTAYQKTFYLGQPTPPRGIYLETTTQYIGGIPFVSTEGELLPYTWGKRLASEVAKDIADFIKLKLVWDCPDYDVINFDNHIKGFKGTALSCLQELINPLNQTDLFKIDIFIHKDTIYVKKRKHPYKVDYVIPSTDIRIKNLSITRTKYRDKKIKNIYIGRNEKWERINWSRKTPVESPPEVIDTKDKYGTVIHRKIITTLKADLSMVRKTEQTFKRFPASSTSYFEGLHLIEHDTENYIYENDWMGYYDKLLKTEGRKTIYIGYIIDSSLYFYKSETQNYNITQKYGFGNSANILQSSHKITSKGRFNKKGYLVGKDFETEEIVTYYNQIAKQIMDVTTTKYTNGNFIDSIVHKQAGEVPSINKTATVQSTTGTTFWWEKIVVNTAGEDLELHNDLLSRELLRTIAQEIKTEQLAKKFELSLFMLPMPWLRKGMVLQITGSVSDANGNTFDLSQLKFLVTNITHSKDGDQYTGTIQGVSWL